MPKDTTNYEDQVQEEILTNTQKKQLQTYRERYQTERSPLQKAGIFNIAFFNWVSPMLKLAKQAVFQQDYHYNLREIDTGRYCYDQIHKNWVKRNPTWSQPPGTKTNAMNLIKVILLTYPRMFALYIMLSMSFSGVEFLNAQIMNLALKELETYTPETTFETKFKGAGRLVTALVFSQAMITIINCQNVFIIRLLTQRIKHGVNGLIFDKVMMKSIKRDTTFSIGEITNITQVDVERISNMGSYINRLFIAPFEIIIGHIWLYFLVGNALFFGLILMIFIVFANYVISIKYKKYRTKFLDVKDRRGKLITEVFSNIRFIKMSGLENYFLQKIQDVKDEELKWIQKNLVRGAYSITVNNATPVLFLAAIFGSYIWLYGNLDVAMIFTVIQIYNIFRNNFRSIPYIIMWMLDLVVSGQRITFFLLSENIDSSYITLNDRNGENEVGNQSKDAKEGELRGEDQEEAKGDKEKDGSSHAKKSPKYAIVIKDGYFYWEDEDLKTIYVKEKDRIAEKEDNKAKSRKKKRTRGKKTNSKNRKSSTSSNSSQITDKRLLLSTIRSGMSRSIFSADQSGKGSLAFDKSEFDDSREFQNYSKLTEKLTKGSELTDSLLLSQQYKSQINELYQGINLTLNHLNLKIETGKCVALIGKVGSGKSSLLSCLSGELYHKIGSKITINGSMSYVGQKAWIASKTVRENILFGQTFDEQRYKDSIKYACMTDDLKILAKKDDTLLGDKGVNLSGGQKIRLSIARALYSNSDIYLFDDPISALDIHVGKYVMEEGIVGYLKGKTRIVATHAIAYLKFFDYIYVMDDGEIIAEGSYQEIIESDSYRRIRDAVIKEDKEKKKKQEDEDQDNRGDLEKAADDHGKEATQSLKSAEQRPILKKEASSFNKTDESLMSDYKDLDDPEERKLIQDIIQNEDRAKGSMSLQVLANWIFLTGGFPRWIFIFITMCVWSVSWAAIPWFLQWWATNFKDVQMSRGEQLKNFLGIYMSINFLQIGCNFIRTLTIFGGNVEMSKEVNFMMTFKLMHASINKYFDRVPMGRILNRFMKDVQVVDNNLAWSTSFVNIIFFRTVVCFVVSGLSSSAFVFIIIAFYVYLSFRIQRYYMNLQRELTRLSSISSTPIIQKFKEGLDGVSTIRIYDKFQYIFDEYLELVNRYQENQVSLVGANNWFQVRVSVLSLIVIIPCIYISLFVVNSSVGIFGLMLNFLLQMTQKVNSLLDGVSSQENNLISMERCTYFMNLKPEVGYRGLNILESALRRNRDVRINTNKLSWPKSGDLVIKNLSVKYRKGLPYVLKKINLRIKSGTKVGIVGRTGAGKTTLISSIYRTFDEYKGQILIDGKEIRDVDLKILRYTMTIIPQDPYLFEDSVRNNIDPMEQFKDEDIELILDEVGLWKKFCLLRGLETRIEKGGSNLSQGEKQLVCLARALLFKNKLVLMDEATANIDTQTEAIIQNLIKKRFVDSTILMIAHRLNTILHCDKVLVLDQGKVLEFDDLKNLKGNKDSHFGRMLMKSDEINESLK